MVTDGHRVGQPNGHASRRRTGEPQLTGQAAKAPCLRKAGVVGSNPTRGSIRLSGDVRR